VDLIVDRYDKYFEQISLKPSDGGRFEIVINDTTIFSKLESDRFPEDDELLDLVAEEIGAK
jgi:selT/selW/selH-like putative selenoprotein